MIAETCRKHLEKGLTCGSDFRIYHKVLEEANTFSQFSCLASGSLQTNGMYRLSSELKFSEQSNRKVFE